MRRCAAQSPVIGASRAVVGFRRRGFTLIELMVVMAIVGVLLGMLFPVISMIRKRMKVASTQATIDMIAIAMESYKQIDERRRYPLHEILFTPPAVPPYDILGVQAVAAGYPEGVLGLLFDMKLLPLGRMLEGGKIVDAWDGPIYYHLRRPTPAKGGERFVDWNWDAGKSRARQWDDAHDRPAPYPYVFSLGPEGSLDDGRTWMYHAR